MSCSVWFKQEATVNTYEDFLVSRHEYLLNRLTSSATFDSSNISQLASEILLTLHTMDCTQDTNVSYIVPSLGSILESRWGKWAYQVFRDQDCWVLDWFSYMWNEITSSKKIYIYPLLTHFMYM
jgi:hypothetical protein